MCRARQRRGRAGDRLIAGLEVVELHESEACRGSAGIDNLTEPAMARRLFGRKVGHLARAPMRVLHVVELLDQAYAAAEGGA